MTDHPTDDEINQAATVVARHLLARAARDGDVCAWEDYPEILEHHWDLVVQAAVRQAPFPDPKYYDWAYRLLSADEVYGLFVDYADGHREVRRLTPEQAASTDIDSMAGDLNPSDWHPQAEITNFYVAQIQ